MNQQALASALDVSTKSVVSWIRKGCPVTRTKTGGYHFTLRKVLEWRAANFAPQTVSTPTTFQAARARKEAALAELRELELRRKKGELVLRESVAKATFAMVRQMRDKMTNIPDRVAGICAAATDQAVIHALLTKEIHEACEDLSHHDYNSSATSSVE